MHIPYLYMDDLSNPGPQQEASTNMYTKSKRHAMYIYIYIQWSPRSLKVQVSLPAENPHPEFNIMSPTDWRFLRRVMSVAITDNLTSMLSCVVKWYMENLLSVVVNGGSDSELWVFIFPIKWGAIRSYQEFPNHILVYEFIDNHSPWWIWTLEAKLVRDISSWSKRVHFLCIKLFDVLKSDLEKWSQSLTLFLALAAAESTSKAYSGQFRRNSIQIVSVETCFLVVLFFV